MNTTTRTPAVSSTAKSPMLSGPVIVPITTLALPTIVVMLVQVLITLAEFYFISRLGTAELAGAILVVPLQILMSTMSAGGVGSGVSSTLARAFGAGESDTLKSVFTLSAVLAVIFGGLFFIGLRYCSPYLYSVLGGTGPSLQAAIDLSTSLACCAIPLWLTNLLSAAFRGIGKSAIPSKVTSLCAVCLLPALPAFIFGYGPVPAFGIAGVDWALTLYYLLTAVILSTKVSQSINPSRLTAHVYASTLVTILKTGLPSCLNAIQSSVLNILLSSWATAYGTAALAAYGIAARLETALIPLLFGFASSTLTVTGVNYGAKNYKRARQAALVGAALTLMLTLIPSSILLAKPEAWIALFTSDPAVVALSAPFLSITLVAYPVFAVAFVLGFAIQGTGHALLPLLGVTVRLVVTIVSHGLMVAFFTMELNALALAYLAGVVAQAVVCLSAMRVDKVWRTATPQPGII